MQNPLNVFIALSQKIGARPTDSKDDKLRKQTLVMISMLIGIAGVIWGIMYLIIGLVSSSLIPLVYSLLIAASILLFYIRKIYSHFLLTELFLTLLLPFFLQWNLGGFAASGAVMIWAFLAPMGALMFQGKRESVVWFIAYIVLIIISMYLDQTLAKQSPDISSANRLLFYLMNITVVSAITFSTILYFVSEQFKDKTRNLELLEITRKSRQEIEAQYTLLTEQSDVLEVERKKTQKLLLEIETLFGQQVSEEVAKELVSGEGEVDSKLCQVTVMFLDIRDFTSYADSKLPKEVASFQNIVFSELINIVRASKGIINQILGDGIMATFGAPVFTTSHINNAVNAGYAMIGKIKQLVNEDKIPPIKIGIGLHTGQVLAGNIGNEFRKQYSLTGSTVIIASRIEQLNKVYNSQFLISDDIYKEVKNMGYPISRMDEVKLKGIEQPIEIYRLV